MTKRQLLILGIVAVVATLIPDLAFAASDNLAWTTSSGSLVDSLTGGWTRNAAILFTIGAALMLFFGDVSGMQRRLVQGTLAFGLVFGAPAFIDLLFPAAASLTM